MIIDFYLKALRLTSDPKSSANDVVLSELKSHNDSESQSQLETYKREPNKKFYMNVDMKYIDSPEFHQKDLFPYDMVDKVNQDFEFHTPVFNSINFMMPSQPLLFHDTQSIQVGFILVAFLRM